MQSLSQEAAQQLEQRMSQSQLQSLEVLAMSSAELNEKISAELAANPALEITKEPLYTKKTPKPQKENATLSSYRQERRRTAGADAVQARDNFNAFLENIPDSTDESLQQHLLAQLHLERLPVEVSDAAERIIQNLDENGFHRIPLAALFEKELKHNKQTKNHIRSACTHIRRFDPIGCAVQNFKESLLVQAHLLFYEKKESNPVYAYTLDILKNHFSYLEKARPYSLVQAVNRDKTIPYKINTETAEQILQLISTLDPFPGTAYTPAEPEYITPTAFIETENGEIRIVINTDELPQLTVSAEFTELAKNSADPELKEYLKPHMQNAKLFIGSLNQREKTILSVLQLITQIQQRFFLTGDKKALVPLTQHYIAQELSIHESTVSRAVSNKYLQCEWGTFEIQYFFGTASGSHTLSDSNSDAVSHTKESIKELIKELTDSRQKKLSDQKIADMLHEKYGITLARRTVNKYRKELKTG